MGVFGPGEDFFTVKGAMEVLAASLGLAFAYQRETGTPWLHPGIAASVWCKGKRLGVFGKLSNEINAGLKIAKDEKESQNIYLAELDYEALSACVEGELPGYDQLDVKTRALADICGLDVIKGQPEALAAPKAKQ